MDEVTERQVIQNLSRWLGSRTLIVATHRLPVLSLVEHVLVLEGGKPVLLDTRDKVLQSMRGGRLNPAAVVPATSAKSVGAAEEVPQAGAAGGGHE
jgi:ATP-binding cassette subfamily C protein LapB